MRLGRVVSADSMFCDDPLVRAFRSYGYNLVRLPSKNFLPLLLLESDGHRGARVIGNMETELRPSSYPLPTVERDIPVSDLSVTATRRLSGNVAGRFLGPLLGAMGSAPGLAIGLSDASEIVISVREVYRDSVLPGDLARCLEAGLEMGSRHVRSAAEKQGLYLVTGALKSSRFTTTVSREVAQKLGGSAPITAGAVDVHVDAEADQSGRQVLSFSGRERLTFAFSAIHLIYDDGRYVDYSAVAGLMGYQLPAESSSHVGRLLLEDDLVDVEY